MDRTQITINMPVFDQISKIKDEYGLKVGHRVTWDEFLSQAGIIVHSYFGQTTVQAERLNRYWYRVECPHCHKSNGPLISRRAVVWTVKCDCGTEFIAVA